MQQNEKIQKELQALRKENARLKAKLSKIDLSPSEKDLLLKEEQLRDAYELANISAWSYDIKTNILTPSEQLTRVWSPPQKNVREAFLARMHPDDREKLLPVIENLDKYDSYDYQYRIIGDNGKMYYFYCRGMVKRDKHGKAVKVFGLNWDITEKKLYEKQTLQTENNLHFFFEKIGLGAWEYNIGDSKVYFSDAIRRLLKLKSRKGFVLNEDVFQRIHFQDLERVKTSFEKVVAGEKPIFDCMYRISRNDNQYVWVLSRGVPIFDSKAQVHKVIGSLEDLSQSKRYNVIKERLNFMQRIADALPIPVYYKDMNGRYVGHNEAFKGFISSVGTKSPKLVGYTLSDVHSVSNKDVGSELVEDEKLFLTNPSESFAKTYTLTTSSGDKRFVINKKSILHDSHGNPKYLVGGILDITEHEKVKAEARIHQEQLLLADKMKSLGILISGVAHEINNPNHFININVVLLQKIWEDLKPIIYEKIENSPDFNLGNIPGDKLEESINDLLFGIKDGSERIGRIIDSLKAYIRNVPVDIKETFDLYDAIENVIFLLKNQMTKATAKFTIERKNKNLPVNGVQQQIEQVIINVLQNACQALTSREQSIRIETGTDRSGKLAIVKVIDTGIGIEAQHLNFITDPFFTTKRETGGTGLGLSISSSILEEHKGRFNFNSEPGKGTVVEIILPLVHDGET